MTTLVAPPLFARAWPVQSLPMGRALLLAIAVFLLSAGGALAAAPQTWEYGGGGQWPQTNAPATQVANDPTLDHVEQLIQAKKGKAAEKVVIPWLLSHKGSPQRDRGLFLTAQAFYEYGDHVKAYYYCDELMDEYPDSRYYTAALEFQYKIADEFLNGYKRRFCGIPMFHAYDEAIEMLYRVQQRSPGSPLAEKALLRTANYYYNDQQYDFAADTYAAYVRSYPRSPQVPRVRLRQAFANYAQFRGPKFDATPLIDAREQLRAIVSLYPDLAKEENIPSLLEQIDRNFARKLYVTGDFYERTHEPRAAAYTYKYLVKAFPQTDEAKRAEVALQKLPWWAVADAVDPPITPGFAPGTPAAENPLLAKPPVKKPANSIAVPGPSIK